MDDDWGYPYFRKPPLVYVGISPVEIYFLTPRALGCTVPSGAVKGFPRQKSGHIDVTYS